MNVIHVENLVKRFGQITAVDNIHLDVDAGQIFGFLGPNGAGKSTTIKILATLLKPAAGSASVAGYDVATKPNDVRRSIGLVFQDQSLDDRLTAQENLWFHAMLYDLPSGLFAERAENVLKLVDLIDRRNSLVRTATHTAGKLVDFPAKHLPARYDLALDGWYRIGQSRQRRTRLQRIEQLDKPANPLRRPTGDRSVEYFVG